MTLQLLDIRPIKNLPRQEKENMPVSIATLPDGTRFVVSRYGDEIWDFYPYIPQENAAPSKKQLSWRILLPDGFLLTDAKHIDLLESAKAFIWSLFADPVEGKKRPMMATLIQYKENIIPLLRWMVKMGLYRFSDLTGRTFDYVPIAKVKRGGGGVVSQETVLSRLVILEYLYHQRHKLHDALQTHPWPHESANSLSGLKKGKPKTDFIPDIVACRLADVALEYINKRSWHILEALKAVAATEETKIVTDATASLSTNTHTIARRLSRARMISARKLGYDGNLDLSIEKNRLRTACYIVIDMFSGARDSEMMSLGERCCAQGRSKDGSMNVYWIQGTIYKKGVRPKKWQVPPIVKEAVEVLTRLTAPYREALKKEETALETHILLSCDKERARLIKRLDTVRKHKDKLFLGQRVTGVISVLSGGYMGSELKRFCADLAIMGEDGRPYPLHAHQFRRTYARFMARSEFGDLLTLRDHLGHWCIDESVFYADGGTDEYETDTELLEMIAKEKLLRQTEIMEQVLDSDAPLANGEHWLKDWRSTVRTASNKEELIAQYAESITLNGTGHSWCVGNAKGTGCGGLCVFEAQMCVDCDYGIIGQEHRPVWEGIRDQQKEALALEDMGLSGKERALTILDYAEKVLLRLDGQEAK